MYYAMVGKTSGWIGFGVGPNTDKTDSDIIEGYVSDGEVKVYIQNQWTPNTSSRGKI